MNTAQTKKMLIVLAAALGMHAAMAEFLVNLKHDAVPAHATLTISGSYYGDFMVTVAGPAAGATLKQFSTDTRGWTIAATADEGYETPTFSTCPYDDANGDNRSSAQTHSGSATVVGYSYHVYNISVAPKKLQVSFSLGGGKLPSGAASSKTVVYDSAYGSLPTPTRAGYVFDGWYTASEGGTRVTSTSKVKIVNSQTLYARWTPITYSVAFDVNGGSGTMAPMTVTYDANTKLPKSTFTRANYAFNRWKSDSGSYYSDGASVVNLSSEAGATVTLYAQWSPLSYTITFDSDGGSTVSPVSLAFGSAVSSPTKPTRAGYVFDRWMPALPDKMPPTNLTVKAVWRVDSYAITFDSNGGSSVAALKLPVGATVTAPTEPARTGHSFDGWSPALPATMPASNLTVTAQWTKAAPVDVTFFVEEGGFKTVPLDSKVSANGHVLTKSYEVGSRIGAAFPLPTVTNVAPEKMSFKSWRFKQDGVWQTVTDDTIVSASSMTNLFVQWKQEADQLATALDVPNLKVASNPVDAWKPQVDSTAVGGQAASVQLSTNVYTYSTGYSVLSATLKGPGTLKFTWRIKSAEIANIPPSPGMTYSEWQKTGERLEFHDGTDKFVFGLADDGNSFLSVTNDTGTSDGTALDSDTDRWQTREFTIAGTAETVTTVRWKFSYMRGSDVDPPWAARAWVDNVRWTGAGTESDTTPTHMVTFDKNSDKATGSMSAQAVREDGSTLSANKFALAGSLFTGWNTRKDGSGLDVADGAVLAAATDVTLYAQWRTGVNRITFNLSGGSGLDYIDLEPGADVILPTTAPLKEGYVFTGWKPALPATMPASNLTVTAQWTPETHWIVFETAGGSELPAVALAYKAKVSVKEPVRTGYTFAGWKPALPATMPASNLTVTAQWTLGAPYTITFNSAGGSAVAKMTVAYGSAVKAPADPVRAGYTFAGWKPALPATMPASNLTVTAQWTLGDPYTITFDSAGGSAVAKMTVAYGSAVKAPANPVREGYTFAGWKPALPATMPASNLTVTATWTPAQSDPDKPDDPVNPSVGGLLYASVSSAFIADAVTYDGYLYDAAGRIAGVVQVKRAKYNANKGLATVTANVTLAGNRKASYRGGTWRADSEFVTLTSTADARTLKVVLGARGLSGTFGSYWIDGALNPFLSKDAAVKADGTAVLDNILSGGGVYALAASSAKGWDSFSVTVKARGKVSVKGSLADGTKLNVSSQLLVGESACCIPVVSTKFAEPAFAIWLTRAGASAYVAGLEEAALSAVGASLASGAEFKVDSEALVSALGSALLTEYLPNGFRVKAADTKWLVEDGALAGKVRLDKTTGTLSTTSKNWASLKLSYVARTGLFSGSFKAYLLADGKLKTKTVKVAGALVNGKGYGTATANKQSAAVTVGPNYCGGM